MSIQQQIKDWKEFKRKISEGLPETSPVSATLYDQAILALEERDRKIEEAVQCLKFYANEDGWKEDATDDVLDDMGIYARITLASLTKANDGEGG